LLAAGQPQLGGHLHASPHWQVAPQQQPASALGVLPPHWQLGFAQVWQAHLVSVLVMMNSSILLTETHPEPYSENARLFFPQLSEACPGRIRVPVCAQGSRSRTNMTGIATSEALAQT
jgi:hypothetical protein